LLPLPAPRAPATSGRHTAGRTGVAGARTVVAEEPESGRLERGDRCAMRNRVMRRQWRSCAAGRFSEGPSSSISARLLRVPAVGQAGQALPDW